MLETIYELWQHANIRGKFRAPRPVIKRKGPSMRHMITFACFATGILLFYADSEFGAALFIAGSLLLELGFWNYAADQRSRRYAGRSIPRSRRLREENLRDLGELGTNTQPADSIAS